MLDYESEIKKVGMFKNRLPLHYFLTAEFAFCSGMYDSRIPRFERKRLDREDILMFARTSCFSVVKLQRLCINVS